MLIQYIKRNKKKVGVLVSDKYFHSDGTTEIGIGWSLCHKKDRDKGFNEKVGILIAFNRAITFTMYPNRIYHVDGFSYIINGNDRIEDYKIPVSIRKQLNKFIGRAQKYYKNTNLTYWAYNYIHGVV